MIQSDLKKWVGEVLGSDLPEGGAGFVVEASGGVGHGDYATNLAMVLSKKLGKNPLQIAQDFAEKLNSEINNGKIDSVEKVEAVRPGFINFFLKPKVFAGVVRKIVTESENVGKNEKLAGQKIIVEYTVTNVLKPMHIGHLMGNVIGESISRIIENESAEVKRNNYQGDSGLHIAKAVWGIKKLGGKIDGTTSEKSRYIGQAYATGSNSYEDDEKSKEEIKEINKKIFDKTDDELLELYKWGREVSLAHFEQLYKKLGTKFDFYFFESEVADDALKIIREFLKKGLFEESDGAVVFHGEKYDSKLHTRVFINSQDIPMYEAKDIAHAVRKYRTYKFDKSIIITANEQDEYFKVVLRALEEINPEIARKTQHLSHGILKLPSGKMGSRKGNVITGEELISDVEKLVEEKIKDRDFSPEQKKEILEIVAIGAIKYSILRQAVGGDIIFDFAKSLSFEGDSGPYLQYSAVRANSILKKVKEISRDETWGIKVSPPEIFKMPDGWQTTDLEKMFEKFDRVVSRAGDEYAPHYIVTYLTELASSFNAFYANNKIIDESDVTSSYKLAITQAFVNIMSKGLDLLGIKVPEQM